MEPIKRVAAIHDLSGFGRCSLTVVLPVLSAMGAQCCPLPTALLSTHTAFPGYTFLDLTQEMETIEAHWAALGLYFDAIYSGFLGSQTQIEVVRRFIARFSRSDMVVLCDPVMGDNGKPYRTYTTAMCREMAALAADATLITPNVTEAALLLGKPYEERPRDEKALKDWLYALSLQGKRSVVMTGLSFREGEVSIGVLDRESGAADILTHPFVGQAYFGTGDLFASVLLGRLLQGCSLRDSVQGAADFVSASVALSWEDKAPVQEGVRFESLLHTLGNEAR